MSVCVFVCVCVFHWIGCYGILCLPWQEVKALDSTKEVLATTTIYGHRKDLHH